MFDAIAANLKTYDHSMILGQMAWYSTSEIKFNHNEFVIKLHEHKLDHIFLPPPPRSVDVFRRACSTKSIKNNSIELHSTGEPLTYRYFIEEVASDTDAIYRQLVRQKLDSKDHCLEFFPVCELMFDRKLETIQNKILKSDEISPILEGEIVAKIKSNFANWSNLLTAYAIRQVIVKVLQSFSATVVRPSGALYFVSEYYYEDLIHLEDLINSIKGCSFHTLPLLDDKKQRGMLRKAFEDESVEQVDRSLEDIRKIFVEGKQITSDKYSVFFDEYKLLTTKTKEYADLLEENMDMTSARLALYEEQIFHLLERVK